MSSGIASWITILLGMYTLPRSLGHFISESGTVRLRPGVVRAPDISFIRKDRLPDGKIDMTPIGELIPDLAIEIISATNTKAEIERKIGEYFLAGIEAVWIVDHFRRVVVVYSEAQNGWLIDMSSNSIRNPAGSSARVPSGRRRVMSRREVEPCSW